MYLSELWNLYKADKRILGFNPHTVVWVNVFDSSDPFFDMLFKKAIYTVIQPSN